MEKKTDNTFEILHLVVVLSLRFDKAFVNSDINQEQIYTLAYLHYLGIDYEKNGKKTKIEQRETIAKILKKNFLCDDDKCKKVFDGIKQKNFIEDFEVELDKKRDLFGDGRTRVLSITDEGIKKIEQFKTELKKLHNELLDSSPDLLFLPQAEEKGFVAGNLVFFLQHYLKIKEGVKKVKDFFR